MSTENNNYNNENEDEDYETQVEVQPRVKRKHHKHHRSLLLKAINQKNKPSIPVLIIEIILGFIVDTLNIIKNLVLGLIVIIIICCLAATIFIWVKVKPIYTEYNTFATDTVNASTVATFKPEGSTYIYDTDENIIAKMHGDQDAEYIEYDNIPQTVIDAFVAVEDQTFWDNPGIDMKGIIRVGVNYIKTHGDEAHGASTITQQLARNAFLTREVSLERKAKEMLISLKLTKKYTKKQIMEFYCNDICFANAYYGIEAAAKGYFGKSCKDLSISQLAYLCAIPNSPSYYDPYKYPERALERRNKILKDMLDLGTLTQSEYDEAIAEKITISKQHIDFKDYQTTFASDCATKYIMKEDGFNFKYAFDNSSDYTNYKKDYTEEYDNAYHKLVTGGYKIYTTLDSTKQSDLQSVLDNDLSFSDSLSADTGVYDLQGAMTVIDNSNGKVVAIIGGRTASGNSADSSVNYSLNRAYQSNRQPGSSIKPLIVYTPALENGYTPDSIVYNIDIDEAKKKGADVQALRGKALTLRSALEQSLNGVAWQVFDALTPEVGLQNIVDMEYSKICPDDYYDAAALGGLTYGVTTVEQASGYSTLENHGEYREPTCISSIIDSTGKDIYNEYETKRVYDSDAADTMTDMMTGVLTKGTAASMKWYKSTDMVAACKTGTTNDSKDGWLCGYTPYYTIAVWVGYDQPKTLNNLYGGTYPAQIWKDAMLDMISDKEVKTEFEQSPDNDGSTVSLNSIYKDASEFLPGRSDDEVLADGYTVGDYRADRVKGEQIEADIIKMRAIDKKSSGYYKQVKALYEDGKGVLSELYSRKYTKEMTEKLESAYKSATGKSDQQTPDATQAALAALAQQQAAQQAAYNAMTPEQKAAYDRQQQVAQAQAALKKQQDDALAQAAAEQAAREKQVQEQQQSIKSGQ